MKVQDFLNKLKAGKLVETVFDAFHVKVNYTGEGLKELEEFIKCTWSEGHQPTPSAIIPFGLVLGETIVRNFKEAEWVNEEFEIDDFLNIKILIKKEGRFTQFAKPFKRARRFFDDHTESLYAMYRLIETQIQFDVHSEEFQSRCDENGWITFDDGFKFRILKADEAIVGGCRVATPQGEGQVLKVKGINMEEVWVRLDTFDYSPLPSDMHYHVFNVKDLTLVKPVELNQNGNVQPPTS